jgi:protein involved in temperature-dependent protein secretion
MNYAKTASVFQYAAEIADARVTADPSDLAARAVAKTQYVRAGHYEQAAAQLRADQRRAEFYESFARFVVYAALALAAYSAIRYACLTFFA